MGCKTFPPLGLEKLGRIKAAASEEKKIQEAVKVEETFLCRPVSK